MRVAKSAIEKRYEEEISYLKEQIAVLQDKLFRLVTQSRLPDVEPTVFESPIDRINNIPVESEQDRRDKAAAQEQITKLYGMV